MGLLDRIELKTPRWNFQSKAIIFVKEEVLELSNSRNDEDTDFATSIFPSTPRRSKFHGQANCFNAFP